MSLSAAAVLSPIRKTTKRHGVWVAATVGLDRSFPAGHSPPVVNALLRRRSFDGLSVESTEGVSEIWSFA